MSVKIGLQLLFNAADIVVAGRFAGGEGLLKQMRRLREPWEYEVTVGQFFTLALRP